MKAKSVAGFALGPVIAAILGFITLPTMAWVFSPKDLGRYNIFTITIGFVVILLCLGLDQAYVREYHETNNPAGLMRVCLRPVLLSTALALALALAFSATVSELLFASPDRAYTLLLAAAVVVSVLVRFLSLILRMQERGVAYSLSQIIPKSLVLVSIAVVGLTELDASFLVLASASVISLSSILLVYAWNTRAHWKAPSCNSQLPPVRRLLRYGVPLTLAGIAYWGLTATSAVSLRVLSSFTELGIYAVTVGAAGIVFTLQSVFSTIWAPIVFRWSANEQAKLRVPDVARLGGFLASGLAAIVGMFSWLVSYILPSDYSTVEYIVVCAVLPPILYGLAEVTGIGVNLERRTGLALFATVVAFVSNVVMSLMLVPYLDAVGAAIANALAFSIYFVVLTEASCRVWLRTSRVRLYVSISATLLLSCVHAATGGELDFSLSWLWIAMFAAVLLLWPAERALLVAFLRSPRATLRR